MKNLSALMIFVLVLPLWAMEKTNRKEGNCQTLAPTCELTESPTLLPTELTTESLTLAPTCQPTEAPTLQPTQQKNYF